MENVLKLEPINFKKFKITWALCKPTATDYQKLAAWLLQRAMEHDRPLLLLQLLIKKLETSKIMRPGLTVLERMVATARNEAWIETYNCWRADFIAK